MLAVPPHSLGRAWPGSAAAWRTLPRGVGTFGVRYAGTVSDVRSRVCFCWVAGTGAAQVRLRAQELASTLMLDPQTAARPSCRLLATSIFFKSIKRICTCKNPSSGEAGQAATLPSQRPSQPDSAAGGGLEQCGSSDRHFILAICLCPHRARPTAAHFSPWP